MQTLLMPSLSLTLRQELWLWSIYLKLFVDNNVELDRQCQRGMMKWRKKTTRRDEKKKQNLWGRGSLAHSLPSLERSVSFPLPQLVKNRPCIAHGKEIHMSKSWGDI